MAALGQTYQIDPNRVDAGMAELQHKALLINRPPRDGADAPRELTRSGCETLARLVTARRTRLAEVLSEWAPERRQELAASLDGFPHELVPDAPQHVSHV